jgi:hypothetical protein
MGNVSESLAGRDEIVNLKSFLLLGPSGFAANRNRNKHRARRFELGVSEGRAMLRVRYSRHNRRR